MGLLLSADPSLRLLEFREPRDQRSHAWRTDTGCQIVTRRRGVNAVVGLRLADPGDIVEVARRIQVE